MARRRNPPTDFSAWTLHNPKGGRSTRSRRRGLRRPNAEEMGSTGNVGWSTLKEYGETWPEAYWRELVQNSVDAGATQIDLYMDELGDGNWIAGCKDNGTGMSEEVFRNKFLKHGGTTKGEGSDAAGGFGAAKRLLLAPWVQWQIRTGNMVAVGQMSRHEVWVGGKRITHGPQEFDFPPQWKGKPPVKGVIFEAVMTEERRTTSNAARVWLSKCYLPRTTVKVDGRKNTASLNATTPINTKFHSPVAGYFIKNRSPFDQSFILVRTVSGPKKNKKLAMFTRPVDSDVGGVIVLELLSHSVEYLKASRNDPDGHFYWELDALIAKLNQNPLSAIRGPKMFRHIYRGPDGVYKARAMADERADRIKAVATIGPTSVGAVSSLSEDQKKTVEEAVKEVRKEVKREKKEQEEALPKAEREKQAKKTTFEKPASHAATAVIVEEASTATPEQQAAMLRQLVWTPDYYLHSDLDGFKVSRSFKPATMSKGVKELMEAWVEICRYVLVLLGCSKEFGVGYVFSDKTAAMYARADDTSWLMLNPHKDFKEILSGKAPLWNLKKEEDLRWIYACAVHEATHMANGISNHNEVFTSAFTANVAKCADGFTRIRQLIGQEAHTARSTTSRSPARRSQRVAVDPKQRGLFDF